MSKVIKILGITTVVLGFLAGTAFIGPIIVFWLSYFGGWILAQFVGEQIIFGFNTIFNREVVTLETIPVIIACLGVIGNKFKSYNTSNTSKSNKN